ncbi:MAG: hypothetical protein GTO63_09795, partial [Anaerolineae bacterium]|nr:hypothetical protein [Anaerolineae bacterium]NIN95207.1 hypothetical protein [Anaerolineae bacterium]
MKQANHGDSCTEQPKIDRPYLLVTSIPYFLGADGSIWLEQLWHRDLAAHVRYLERLTLAAPCYPKTAESHLVRLDIPSGVMLRLQAIPRMESTLGAVLRFPKTVATLWSAIGQVEIVHSGVAGWPYPIGWVANSIALARRKKLILVVESTPWRLIGSSRHNWKHRLRARVAEPLARFFVDRADLCIFTQPGYRDSLLTQ